MKSDEAFLLEEKYNGDKSQAFYEDCKALALGEPLAYLIGHAPFLDCTIDLTGRPLIPRPETEFWTEKAIVAIKESQGAQPSLGVSPEAASINILDLCAGSGCIGVAVAKHVPQAAVTFCEIDARLLPTIQTNIDANITDPNRCAVYHSNLFIMLPPEQKYHFILSNPPYIDPALNRVDLSVKDFEPHLALFGGKEGMTVIEQLISSASDYLVPGGQLWIEHEPEQVGALASAAHQHNFTITHHVDQYDAVRYSVLVVV